MTGEVGVEDSATGGYRTVDEEFTEIGYEELHCLRGLRQGVEGWGGVEWYGGDVFVDHGDEFVAGVVDVAETAVVFY